MAVFGFQFSDVVVCFLFSDCFKELQQFLLKINKVFWILIFGDMVLFVFLFFSVLQNCCDKAKHFAFGINVAVWIFNLGIYLLMFKNIGNK